jgi:hypothetical protein
VKDTIAHYLQNRSVTEQWPLDCGAPGDIEQVVVIPGLAEEAHLFHTLDDLAKNDASILRRTLIICVVNNREEPLAAQEDLEDNQRVLQRLRAMQGDTLQLGIVDAASPGRTLPQKEGVGLARKIGLDHGCAMLHRNELPNNPLISVDADTRLKPGYLSAIHSFFTEKSRWVAIIPYAHPLDGHPSEQAAILCYEIFLRYYVLGLAYAKSPYAFVSMGSTIVCTPEAYAAVSGMKRSQAGEDFYFLQKLVKTGSLEHLTTTTVFPSARSSHRVPFGTGRAIQEFLQGDTVDSYTLYAPESFRILRDWLRLMNERIRINADIAPTDMSAIDPVLADFLSQQHFERAWKKIHANARSAEQLLEQFHGWFDGFRTFKLMHHLRDHGHPDEDMFTALGALLERMKISSPLALEPSMRTNLMKQQELLLFLRTIT